MTGPAHAAVSHRVLFVTHNVPRFVGDAAGSFVLRFAVGLKEIGVDVEIIAPGGSGLPERDEIEGVSITRVRYASPDRMSLAYDGKMVEVVQASWAGKLALLRLMRALRRETLRRVRDAGRLGRPFTVVHAHWWFPSALAIQGAFARGRGGVPAIAITMHGSDVRLAQRIGAARRVMRAVLTRASLRTAVSSWLADTAARIAPDARIHVAPMPVDVRHFDASPEADTGDARDGVLFVGRLNAQKGLADLLHALAQPALVSATLNVVGDGSERANLQSLAGSLGLDGRVRWLGHVAQNALPPLYRRASVVAMPSIDEGLGLVAVEAQLCGTPVVAYASGGLPDVVRPDGGGTLVAPGDVTELANGIAQLLRDSARARDLGEQARNAMVSRFTPSAVAHRYRALYDDAVSSRGIRSRAK